MVNKKKVTAKRKMVKKKNSLKKNSLNKGLFVILGLFLVFSVLSFVGYTQSNITGNSINDIWKNAGQPAELDEAFLRWVFFAILTIAIYSAFSTMSFPSSGFVRWLLSIPIGFILVYMINRTDFLGAIYNYGTLGLTLITLGPLMAVFWFSAKFIEDNITLSKIVLVLLLWGGYLIFSVYNFFKYVLVNVGWIVLKEDGVQKFIESLGWFPIIIFMFSMLVPIIVIKNHEYFLKKFMKLGKLLHLEKITESEEAEKLRNSIRESSPFANVFDKDGKSKSIWN